MVRVVCLSIFLGVADFHLIVFLDSQNLGIDTKIVFLCCLVPELLNISYYILAIMLIYANEGNYEKCLILITGIPRS